jgi:L-lactate dehydrogenase
MKKCNHQTKESENMRQTKLVVIGVGHVGSQVLTDCSHLNLFSDIALIDVQQNVAKGEALDHRHALAASYRTNSKIYAGDYADCAGADVIIISAGVSEKPRPGEDMPPRALMGKENAAEIRKVMHGITQHTKDAVLILITNPVDTITYIAENEFHYPKGKIFGTGTTLDTFRYRQIVAGHYGVDPKEVSGFIVGEHGSTAFPAFSSTTVGGLTLPQCEELLPQAEPFDAAFVQQEVVHTASDVFNWKGWTNSGIGEVAAALARAVMLNEKSIFPVTATVDGLYNCNGEAAFSMPCIIGRNGLEKQIELPLNAEEYEKLQLSIKDIQNTLQYVQ